ncbi:MAG TPA: amylo-alpha-1,6-glucosidase [Caulobacter sp.]|nr:amylo-alpha-1,6-glucosidase [Caulobacter sp.]
MNDIAVIAPVLDEQRNEGPLKMLALKAGDCFLVADGHGDILGGPDGLFQADTRILSRLRLLIGGASPTLLSSGVSADNVVFIFHGANRPLPPAGGRVVAPGVLHVERQRLVHADRLYERIRLTNHGLDEVLAPLSIEFEADFRDIFEVRGQTRRKRGRLDRPRPDGRAVHFHYEGLDGVTRTSVIAFSEPPARLTTERADFLASFLPRASFELFLEVGATVDDIPDEARFRRASAAARRSMRTRTRSGVTPRSDSPSFNRWTVQSRTDLALLTTDLPTGRYPYAGIPWFSTPFGRDGILTAWEMLLFDPGLAAGVLNYLAARQANETDAFRDSQPGKIMHETRKGEMSTLGEVPFGLYYGGVDTTPLYIALAGAYARHTGDLALIRGIWPALKAAVGWLETYGDSNGDGLIDYARAAETGLSNQGWKDSYDSVFHADGRFPKGPVALVEVQGYAFAAWRAMADLARRLGEPGAEAWEARAEAMRAAVEDRFWMEEVGGYGIAIDGEGQLCRSLTSNAGHLLFVGLPTAERGRRVIDTLSSAAFSTGWGVRTLARGESRYNPMSYHNGSIWPHDNAVCAAGMGRYGDREHLGRMLRGLFDTASEMGMRLPELFCGFPRRPGEPPVPYPVSCSPQAWAAGSVFMMLQALLGISVDAFAGEVRIERPRLPAGVNRLSLPGLTVGDCAVDLVFERVRDGLVVASAVRCPAGVQVISVS